MTRINAFISPAQLSDQHLLAEHREIVRIPNLVKKRCTHGQLLDTVDLGPIPKDFTLGTGHVRFFYDKIYYLSNRYIELYKECVIRGFKVTYMGRAFVGCPLSCYNNWNPDLSTQSKIQQIVMDRIDEKIKAKPDFYTHCKQKIYAKDL